MATPFPIPVTAAQVGTYFVGQYYQVLQSQPEFVHQFYSDASTMLRIDGSTRETAAAMLVITAIIFVVLLTAFSVVLELVAFAVALRGKKLEYGDGEVVIIGGMVLDIHATPSLGAKSGTTVPGKKKNISVLSLFQMLKPAIWVLLEKGIEVVLVTIGSNGVFLCNKEGPSYLKKPTEKINRSGFGGQLYKSFMQNCPPSPYSGFSKLDKSSPLCAVHFPSLPASVVRHTGAGDCLVGGTLTSICAGLDIMQSVSVGIAVAKAAVEAEANVPNSFNLSAIADDAKSVYSGAKVLFHQSML
ncbi:unnamed protein product [Sphenostylis stenocarpa]|uniref:NTF2 domain-containing protein n=1 Tax=Sphenostylis stenocarpa TaxID=92480 RepID=A0AA86RYU1_9FABA|nr:unnamed protein product [Sphenostylis stenocarpa]